MFVEQVKCISLTVPEFPRRKYPRQLRIDAVGVSLYGNSTELHFHDSTLVEYFKKHSYGSIEYLSFVQTDKSVYSPGDLGIYLLQQSMYLRNISNL